MIDVYVRTKKDKLTQIQNSIILMQYLLRELQNQISIRISEHSQCIENVLELFQVGYTNSFDILMQATKNYLGKLSLQEIITQMKQMQTTIEENKITITSQSKEITRLREDLQEIRNQRNIARVERKTLSMKVKFMDRIITHMIAINKSFMNDWKVQISDEQSKMLKESVDRYRRFSLLSTNDLIKNEKLKVIINPENEDTREVEMSLEQINEILEEKRANTIQSERQIPVNDDLSLSQLDFREDGDSIELCDRSIQCKLGAKERANVVSNHQYKNMKTINNIMRRNRVIKKFTNNNDLNIHKKIARRRRTSMDIINDMRMKSKKNSSTYGDMAKNKPTMQKTLRNVHKLSSHLPKFENGIIDFGHLDHSSLSEKSKFGDATHREKGIKDDKYLIRNFQKIFGGDIQLNKGEKAPIRVKQDELSENLFKQSQSANSFHTGNDSPDFKPTANIPEDIIPIVEDLNSISTENMKESPEKERKKTSEPNGS